MPKYRRISSILGSISAALALTSFILGSAPFTPALVLVFLAVPLALVSGLLGAWRLAAITVYFSIAAWIVVPISRELSFRIDYLLALTALLGAVIGGILYYGYKRKVHVT